MLTIHGLLCSLLLNLIVQYTLVHFPRSCPIFFLVAASYSIVWTYRNSFNQPPTDRHFCRFQSFSITKNILVCVISLRCKYNYKINFWEWTCWVKKKKRALKIVLLSNRSSLLLWNCRPPPRACERRSLSAPTNQVLLNPGKYQIVIAFAFLILHTSFFPEVFIYRFCPFFWTVDPFLIDLQAFLYVKKSSPLSGRWITKHFLHLSFVIWHFYGDVIFSCG